MDKLSEIRSAVQNDLTIGSESSLFPDNTVDLAINRAYRKAGGLFKWPELEDAKKTSTIASQEYYDYPQNWRSDTIFRLEVDGEQYGEKPDGSPMNFRDYLVWRNDDLNDNSTDKKWATQKRRYFIYPVPTTNGNFNICVWGYRVVDKMVNDSDITIFSYSMPECNEAIALEAGAILKSKGEEMENSEFKSVEAKQILVIAWNKVRQEQSKYEKTQPFFKVEDMFGKAKSKNKIGNFDF